MKEKLFRVKYYLKKLFGMDYKAWFKEINLIHQRSGKNRFWLFFDMVLSSLRYGTGYVDYSEFEFYLMNHQEKSTFLTVSISDRIAKKYNDRAYVKYLDDKGLFAAHFKKFLGRDILDLRKATVDEFSLFMKKHQRALAKDFNEMGGQGITLLKDLEIDDYPQLFKELQVKKQFIIEEFIEQHPEMSKLSVQSVNTMRLITFVNNQGKPVLLVSVLKSGREGLLDNVGLGGMYTVLSESGQIVYPMIDQHGHKYEIHPNTQFKMMGFQVPFYQEAVALVKEAALVVPEVRYVGWDVAITKAGPAIIEGNSNSGPFQVLPSLQKEKIGILPQYEKEMGPLT